MATDSTTEVSALASILSQLGALRSPLERLLQRRAVWVVVLPFIFTVGLDLLVALFIGLPPEKEWRFMVSGLFDSVYQTWTLTLASAAWLLQVFFQSVPETFKRLAEQGVIREKEKGRAFAFVQTYQRWFYHRARFVVCSVFALIGVAIAYYLITVFGQKQMAQMAQMPEMAALYSKYSLPYSIINIINAFVNILIMFMGGDMIFRMLVTAALIYRMPTFFEFHIQLSHPDRCGGFKAIGDLCLKMVYVLLVPALFASFWLVVTRHITLSPGLNELLPPFAFDDGFRPPLEALLLLLAVSGVGIFFWPMYTLHTLMLAERAKLQKTLDGIARHIHRLDVQMLTNPSSMPADERKKIIDEIESLNGLYLSTSKVPTWPFDRNVAIKFASTQVIPIISVLGLGGPAGQLIQIVTKLFQGM